MILVVGATGQLGSVVVKDLLQQKRSVRILVRPGSDYEPLVKAGARAVFGDLKAPITLIDALRGVETLITTANSAQRGGDDNVQNIDLIGNRHLVNSAKTVGIKHFIFVSSAQADDKSESSILQAKKKTENHLIQSGMNYTIVAPEPLIETWFKMSVLPSIKGNRPLTLVGDGNRHHSFVSIHDVSSFITASVGNPSTRNMYMPVGGPQTTSWNEMIGLCEKLMGKKIPVTHVQPGEEIPGMTEGMLELLAGMALYDSAVDSSKIAKIMGIKQTSAEDAVRLLLSQQRFAQTVRAR
jgi:uncharacterized protein YbjT (DUF2867 family)